MPKTIQIQNLSFRYNIDEVLKNIDFDATQAEFIGILGANGCGKSTLMKQILGILKPIVGKIEILQKNINEYSNKDLANILGFLPQKSSLTMPLLVEDILYMGRYSLLQSPLKGYNHTDSEQIEKIAKMLQIQHLKKRVALSLSGGEFQRVLLGRALASEPKILLLDEPTSALDLNYAVEIMKICEELCTKSQITTIAILHDLNLASLFCTKIFFLKEGKIIHKGKPKDLYQPKILQEVYGFNCDIIEHQGRPFVILNKEKK